MRLGEDDRAAFGAQGAAPFEPMAGRPMREYLTAPHAMLSAPDQLRPWIAKALAHAAALPAKAPRTARPALRRAALDPA